MKPKTIHIALWSQPENVIQEPSEDFRVLEIRQTLYSKGQEYLNFRKNWDPKTDIVVYLSSDHFESDRKRWEQLPEDSKIFVVSQFPGELAESHPKVWIAPTIEDAVQKILDPVVDEIIKWAREESAVPA